MSEQKFANAIREYDARGYDTLPLLENSKDAFLTDWQTRAPVDLWAHAPQDCNVGLRCSGALYLAVFDADNKEDPQTSTRISDFLDGLGLHECDYPLVQTPNNGRHCYLSLDQTPKGAYKKLPREMGTGEFRFGPGAYVAAPPSVTDGRGYKLIAGDFANLPRVEVADLRHFIGTGISPNESPFRIPTSIAHTTISRKASALLRGDTDALRQFFDVAKGRVNRSDAEQALLASLANSGHDFDSVLRLFLTNPCAGKFQELYIKNRANAIRWLGHSFDSALVWTNSHESEGQRMARRALEFAYSDTWQGQTGSIDRAVLIAHARIALKSGRVIYAAGARDLAELAGVNRLTATKATHRLMERGLIRRVQESTFNLAATYQIIEQGLGVSVQVITTLTHLEGIESGKDLHTSDVFRWHGLGKGAELIWQSLVASPMTIQELADTTGRNRTTVSRIIKKMYGHGMVARRDPHARRIVWQAQDVDFEQVARALGTLGMSEMQRQKHKQERLKYRERLKRNA